MTWNYRVIKTVTKFGPSYAVHEVYHHKDGTPDSWTETPVEVVSETRGGLLDVMARMREGVAKPVLMEVGDKLTEAEPAMTGIEVSA